MLEKYFAARKRLYPQSVKGRFRRTKNILNFVFLAIYCLFPFIRFERAGGAPNQAILIDFPGSKAYFFSIEIWPQEVIYLAGILIIAALALFFVTSLFGRIWCGYGCFQTVWTDIFIMLERLFQGDRNDRLILDRKKNFSKLFRKTLTHISWIIVSLLTGFFFVCYFNDAFALTKSALRGQIGFTELSWILGIAGMTYVMAGFAREHVCTYMCPYSRFQSAMFDDNTLIITYDKNRGETRGKLAKEEREWLEQNKTAKISQSFKNSFDTRGDCIDCKQCVVVCPTGIDIRNGLQLECIACGLCVDACDEVMDKVGLPRGLVRYDTLNHLNDPIPAKKFKAWRGRTFLYSAILIVVSAIMLRGLIFRSMLETSVIPDRNPIFVLLSDGSIRNGYTFKIINKTHEPKKFSLRVNNPQSAILKGEELYEVQPDGMNSFKIFVILPQEIISQSEDGRGLVEFMLKDESSGVETKTSAVFVGK